MKFGTNLGGFRAGFTCLLLVAAFSTLAHGAVISTGNIATSLGNGQWDWTVFITADTATLNNIRCAQYTLHPTFPNPIRVVCERGSDARAFAHRSQGWGEFDIKIKITFQDGKTQLASHHLLLKSQAQPQRRSR
jgi:hypothetical protein